jgi:DNA primase
LASKKVNLKKAANTHGGEYWGPCPACGGNDRFHVWPNQNAGKGGYWCRSCDLSGDNIQFLIDFEGMSFKDACAYLNIDRPDYRTESHRPPAKQTFTPTEHQSPADLWKEKAEKFVTWAQEQLKNNQQQLDWLAARGINQPSAEAARLGWNPGENEKDIFRARKAWGLPELLKENGKPRMLWIPRGLVIPYCPPLAEVAQGAGGGPVQRIRIRRPDGEPRYYVVPGSSMSTMVIGADRRAFVIIESELDGIACAAATELAGAVALGTLQGKPDAAAYATLKEAVQILNALDYGDQGGGKAAAERAMKWWSENFGDRCDRWPVPKGKDPGEAFQMGIDLSSWIEAGLPPVITIGRREAISVKREAQKDCHSRGGGSPKNSNPPVGTPPLLAELWTLMLNNPGVKIINKPDRFTILRNGKYVGGRINWLVTREKEVTDYIFAHPSEEITLENLLSAVGGG